MLTQNLAKHPFLVSSTLLLGVDLSPKLIASGFFCDV